MVPKIARRALNGGVRGGGPGGAPPGKTFVLKCKSISLIYTSDISYHAVRWQAASWQAVVDRRSEDWLLVEAGCVLQDSQTVRQ